MTTREPRTAGLTSDEADEIERQARTQAAPPPAEALREALAQYAGALEGIILSLPGRPMVNGVPMSNQEALADLRRRFKVDGPVIEQATLAAGITHALATPPAEEPE